MTSLMCALAVAATLRPQLEAVAKLPGEPSTVAAAGITKAEAPILTIENASAFDPRVAKRRLVIVGDGDAAADAVVAAVRWVKTTAPAVIRRQWIVSAMPEAPPDPTDPLALGRWITFQAPDLVVEVGTGGVIRVAGVPTETIPAAGAVAALRKLLAGGARGQSQLHSTIAARLQRAPLDIARLLAHKYPVTPIISYIPAVSWVNTLRLAMVTGDASLKQKVHEQIAPWLSGEKKLFGDRVQLTAVAGTMIFDAFASEGEDARFPRADQAAIRLADQGGQLAAAERSPGVFQYGGGWTDDMFMAGSVLARTGRWHDREHDLDTAARVLAAYAERLQRGDGLFNHATDGPHAWGRGNGFAALGLMEVLAALPTAHPARGKLLDVYRREMAAVRAQQSPDGAWRQIIDDPASYREESATAMLLTAMARGARLGWIDRSYAPSIERAWRALAAHVADDGTVIDVCTSTGGGPTRRYYFDRQAITGADDRGGAMALLASMEMYDFSRIR